MEKREIGILLHISCLPSRYGIGTFGKEAYQFVNFLKKAKVDIWQILPLNVTSYGDSPYQSPSNYGFNYYFIDLDILSAKGLLRDSEFKYSTWYKKNSRIDFSLMYKKRLKVLRIAFSRFNKEDPEFIEFVKNNPNSSDFAVFMVLKDLNDKKPWWEWDKKYSTFTTELENEIKNEHKDDYLFYMWTQFEFLVEFNNLKSYANRNNIKIMGDMPIYVARDSVECYKYPEMFQFDENKVPTAVAGCPPDCFSNTGQLWGNPLWNWDYLKKTGYKWYNERIEYDLKLYDYLRIDHFRGFSAYYSVPFGDKTARHGKWVKGPGFDLFKDKLNYPIIAEDLGMIDDDFLDLMKKCNYPGMKIVGQCLLDRKKDNIWRPSNYTENFFSYTSTHDSPTTMGLLHIITQKDKRIVFDVIRDECEKFGIESPYYLLNNQIIYRTIEINIASKARAAIIPLQDLLCVGRKGRMNLPSTVSTDNWSYRVCKASFDTKKEALIKFLLECKEKYRP